MGSDVWQDISPQWEKTSQASMRSQQGGGCWTWGRRGAFPAEALGPTQITFEKAGGCRHHIAVLTASTMLTACHLIVCDSQRWDEITSYLGFCEVLKASFSVSLDMLNFYV